MITLDGSYREGGGQIIRTALALSCLTQKPFCVTKIRDNRPDKGLKNQHLYCIKALKELCNAKAENDILGSTELAFYPGEITARSLQIDIGTAGSITLLLQCIILPCLHAKKVVKITIKGGTDVRWSPSIDYFDKVVLHYFRRYATIECKILKRGYYPKGQGEVEIKCTPLQNPKPLELVDHWKLMRIQGISHASIDLEKAKVAERQAHAAQALLNNKNATECNVNIQSTYANSASTGSGITVWATYSKYADDVMIAQSYVLGADALGDLGKRAEAVGEDAAKKLLAEMQTKAPVDQHTADNLIPLLGLVKGKIKVSKITEHTYTNISVTEQFLDVKFKVDENERIISLS